MFVSKFFYCFCFVVGSLEIIKRKNEGETAEMLGILLSLSHLVLMVLVFPHSHPQLKSLAGAVCFFFKATSNNITTMAFEKENSTQFYLNADVILYLKAKQENMKSQFVSMEWKHIITVNKPEEPAFYAMWISQSSHPHPHRPQVATSCSFVVFLGSFSFLREMNWNSICIYPTKFNFNPFK